MQDNKQYTPELRFPEFHDDWQVYTMETIFVMKNGYTPSKSNPKFWENGTIPWFRMEDIRQNGTILSDSIQHITPDAVKNSGLFPAYSIILATTATIGEHALIIVDSLANQQFTFLTKRKSFDNLIDMMYFYHYMFIIDEWCKSNTNAGGLLSVNMPALKKLQIPISPILPEQRKIALCLSSLDDLIKSVGDKIELLKQHKKGLMQKLFPKTHGTTYGRGNGHGRDAKFCVSTNPTIVPELRFPEFSGDWQVKTLGDIAEINPKSLEPIPTEFYYIDLESVCSGRLQKRQIVQLLNAPSRAQRQFHRDDILFQTVRPYQKNNLYVDFNCSNYIASTGYAVIRCTKEISDSKFIYFVLHKDDFVKSVLDKCTGTSYPAINPSVLGSLSVCFPTLAEQRKIAACLSSIDTAIEETEKKLQMLQQHKKGLMQRMFVRRV
ncbi:MAG: restriction endonuclease subunit S [Bacteroidales bacterium]|nr:restriction endonuclease subunit S [Bacteroidales bacterium]